MRLWRKKPKRDTTVPSEIPPENISPTSPSDEKNAAYWAKQAEKERRAELVPEGPPPENRRGVLDEVGRRHVLQSTSHCGVGVMLVGVWYAALRQLDYLGAAGFFRDEYVVAAHSWLLSAIVAYIHKRQSGDI
jgi:hypothetical protein